MSIDAALIVVGGALLLIGLPSTVLKRLWLSVPMLALLVGLAAGPHALGLVDPNAAGDGRRVLEEFARITLAIALIGTGLQFTRGDLRAVWRPTTALLTIGMVGMWIVTSAGAWLLLDVGPEAALLIGAILTPTDPVVASSLVSGPVAESNLPRSLRRTLQLESGANDGLAVVFVMVAALALAAPDVSAGTIAVRSIEHVGIALMLGPALGYAGARFVDLIEEHHVASESFFLIAGLALAFVILGVTHVLGGSGVLACFAGGVTFSLALGERYAEALAAMQSSLEHLFVVPVFIAFGALLPWSAWMDLGFGGVAFALWALLVRRPAAAALALSVSATKGRSRLFLAWYAPTGVAAIYYALYVEEYRLEGAPPIFAACSLAILVSVVIFSMTATPGVRLYAGRSPWTTLRHPLRDGVEAEP